MQHSGFGLVGDLILGVAGAIAAAFLVLHFGFFHITNLLGELLVATIGAILLVVSVHLVTAQRSVVA